MRKIALISDHASPLARPGGIDCGGQNVYVAKVALGLAAKGWLVDVFTRRDSEDLPAVVEWAEGVRVIHVPAGPPEPVPKETMLGHMAEFSEFVVSLARTGGRPYDLVHANFWMSGMAAMDLKAECGVPFAITFHALGKIRRLHQGSHDLFPDERFEIEQRIMAEAEVIIAECLQEREDLMTLYGVREEKITIVPCGFDPREMWPVRKAAARREIGVGRDEQLLLVLGRMAPRKGVDNAIRGFARLVHDHHIEGRLLVVGGDTETPEASVSPEISRLTRIAEAENVADRVVFVGRRDRERLRYYYSAADVFVTTPSYEPFGITPLEAMACRTAVVASEVGGLKSTVRHGETGCLVSPNDPGQLAACLAQLFKRPSLLRRYARAGRTRALKRFQWTRVVQDLEKVYDGLMRRTGAAGTEDRASQPSAAPLENSGLSPLGLS